MARTRKVSLKDLEEGENLPWFRSRKVPLKVLLYYNTTVPTIIITIVITITVLYTKYTNL